MLLLFQSGDEVYRKATKCIQVSIFHQVLFFWVYVGKYVTSIKRISVCFLVVLLPWGKFYLEKRHRIRTDYWTSKKKYMYYKEISLILDQTFIFFPSLSFLNRHSMCGINPIGSKRILREWVLLTKVTQKFFSYTHKSHHYLGEAFLIHNAIRMWFAVPCMW